MSNGSNAPANMQAAAIDAYGGPDVIRVREVPVPEVGPGDVLIKVTAAGVGVWDAMERSGQMAAASPEAVKRFPRVLGADGSGSVVTVGSDVSDVVAGDAVYAYGFFNAKGGLYAEYAAIPAAQVSRIPKALDIYQAGALAVTGMTALRGIDALKVAPGETIGIFGASGGVGHPAVQLAKAMGLRVVAIVSNDEGAALVREAGADAVVDSTRDDVAAAMAAAATGGLNGVLALVNATGLDQVVAAVRDGGRVAFPNGVQPEPMGRTRVDAIGYDGFPDRDAFGRLDALVEKGPFRVHIAERFSLANAAEAHHALQRRRLGRTILEVA